MLLEWTIGNFKSVAGPVSLTFAPLTVLVGANSSGKSTILQSILTVAQTLSSPLSTSARPLILNGEYLRLGLLTDVLHQGSGRRPIHVGFSLQMSLQPQKAAGTIEVGRNEPLDESLITIKVDSICRPILAVVGEVPRVDLERVSLAVADAHIEVERSMGVTGPVDGSRTPDAASFRVVSLNCPSVDAPPRIVETGLHAKVDRFLPYLLWEQYDVKLEQLREALSLCEQYLPHSTIPPMVLERLNELGFDSRTGEEFRLSVRNALAPNRDRQITSQGYEYGWQLLAASRNAGDWLKEAVAKLSGAVRVVVARGLRDEHPRAVKRLRDARGYQPEYAFRPRPLPEPLESARGGILEYFVKRIRYLGPLRDDPRTLYALPPVPEDLDVGMRGEYTATVLQFHRMDLVICPTPGDTTYGCTKIPLGNAVALWLMHMGLVDDVTTADRGKIGTEVSLRLSDVNVQLDLTNVGVGISQVLPSIVMGLLAPPGSTLLMEQPELHLHPKVQSILADFLLGLAHSGRQCIVESHSEYLVNRLRRRIAEAPGDSVQRLIQLYFVERVGGASQFRSVEPNEYGAIPDWPRGFFDQGPDEVQVIIQAAAKKRQLKLDSLRFPRQEY